MKFDSLEVLITRQPKFFESITMFSYIIHPQMIMHTLGHFGSQILNFLVLVDVKCF